MENNISENVDNQRSFRKYFIAIPFILIILVVILIILFFISKEDYSCPDGYTRFNDYNSTYSFCTPNDGGYSITFQVEFIGEFASKDAKTNINEYMKSVKKRETDRSYELVSVDASNFYNPELYKNFLNKYNLYYVYFERNSSVYPDSIVKDEKDSIAYKGSYGYFTQIKNDPKKLYFINEFTSLRSNRFPIPSDEVVSRVFSTLKIGKQNFTNDLQNIYVNLGPNDEGVRSIVDTNVGYKMYFFTDTDYKEPLIYKFYKNPDVSFEETISKWGQIENEDNNIFYKEFIKKFPKNYVIKRISSENVFDEKLTGPDAFYLYDPTYSDRYYYVIPYANYVDDIDVLIHKNKLIDGLFWPQTIRIIDSPGYFDKYSLIKKWFSDINFYETKFDLLNEFTEVPLTQAEKAKYGNEAHSVVHLAIGETDGKYDLDKISFQKSIYKEKASEVSFYLKQEFKKYYNPINLLEEGSMIVLTKDLFPALFDFVKPTLIQKPEIKKDSGVPILQSSNEARYWYVEDYFPPQDMKEKVIVSNEVLEIKISDDLKRLVIIKSQDASGMSDIGVFEFQNSLNTPLDHNTLLSTWNTKFEAGPSGDDFYRSEMTISSKDRLVIRAESCEDQKGCYYSSGRCVKTFELTKDATKLISSVGCL